jgi:uncharacterized protein
MVSKVFLIFILLITSITGASFDCQKANTPLEKSICADQTLNSLDSSLGVLWKTILKKYSQGDIPDLKAEQKYWIKQRNEHWKNNNDSLKVIYEKRIRDLTLKLENLKVPKPIAGTYVSIQSILCSRGYGEEPEPYEDYDFIRIDKVSNKEITFEISTIGGNARRCDASGNAYLQSGAFIWKDPEPCSSDTCILSISFDSDSIKIVSPNNCNCFCGDGAGMDHIFKKCNIVSKGGFWGN